MRNDEVERFFFFNLYTKKVCEKKFNNEESTKLQILNIWMKFKYQKSIKNREERMQINRGVTLILWKINEVFPSKTGTEWVKKLSIYSVFIFVTKKGINQKKE